MDGTGANLVQRACLNALDDFHAGQVEDRRQNLRALLIVRLPHDEQDSGAMLDVSGRKQLPVSQKLANSAVAAVQGPPRSSYVHVRHPAIFSPAGFSCMNCCRSWAIIGVSSLSFFRLPSYILNASPPSFSTLSASFSG